MNLNVLIEYGAWTIQVIHTHFGWKQSCSVSDCQNATRAQFELVSPFQRITQNVCSTCAASLTGQSVAALNKADAYVEIIKPQFKNLKQLTGLQEVYNHPKNVTGRFNANIGRRYHVFITVMSSGYCYLSINNQPMSPNLNKSIKSTRVATDFAVQVVNNKYKDQLFNHILHGTPFIMP